MGIIQPVREERKSISGFLIRSLLLISCACTHDAYIDPEGGTGGGTGGGGTVIPPVPCEAGVVYFNKDIFPLINTTCAVTQCHDAVSHKDGINLNSYARIMKYVVVNSPDSSKIYKVLFKTGSDRMPRAPYPEWTNSQKSLLADWIKQGAKDNACDFCDAGDFKYSTAIRPMLDKQCVGCHNATASSGGIDLSTYSGVQAVAVNGKLEGAVKWAAGFKPMPAAKKLSDCEIGQVSAWIKAGSSNN